MNNEFLDLEKSSKSKNSILGYSLTGELIIIKMRNGGDEQLKHNIPILSVKLKIPQPRKNYIVREKLFEKLLTINEYKVTIVKGIAGSGKTTLLASFIKKEKVQNLSWITLDENANQPFIFWNYVIEALKDYLGDSNKDFQNFFDSNIQKENLWQIISLFMNKLNIGEDIILVLDDFQNISDRFLISTIDYLIENLPENVHLLLLTREMPEIYLGTLAIEDKIMLIEEEDIRLTREESREFLVNTLRLSHEKEKIDFMIESADGWIGGLQLLATAGNNRYQSILPSTKLSNRVLEDYITKEIFGFLSGEEKEFLIQTSILRYFSHEILQRFQRNLNFEKILNSIFKKNLLIINIDEEAGLYRYHSILAEYSKSIFCKLCNDKKIYLHNRAAKIYYELGDLEESLYHLFAIEEYEKIMDLILKMPQTSLAFAYMMKVPMEQILKNIDFAYQYFFYCYASMDEEKCGQIYQFINKNLPQDKILSAFKNAKLFFDANWKLQEVGTLTLEEIGELPLNPVTTAFILIKEAYFLFLAMKYKKALDYLTRAEKVYKQTGNIYIGFYVYAEKTQILEEMGEMDTCLELYREMEPMILKITSVAPSYYIGIAGVYIRKMQLEKAFANLEKAKESMPKNCENVDRAYLYTLAEYSYLIGDSITTERIITDIMGEEESQNIFYSARLLRYPIYREKNKELAIQFAKYYEAAEDIIKVMDCDLLYASIQYKLGAVELAVKVVDTLIAKARKTQNKLKIVEGDLLKAYILISEQADKREIQDLFIEALSYATENEIAVPFWFEMNTVENIMKLMGDEIRKKISLDELKFLSSILNMDKKKGIEVHEHHSLELTTRERDVLNELANGASNKEIADNLCISLATVKTHIINIYSKFGVNNRVAAVNKMKHKNSN